MTATVTVVVPTYERAHVLSQALDSVLAQSHRPLQIIVVDDGSSDNTARVLSSYADVATVLTRENSGKPAAINAALPLVEGDYLWIFDDDDIACPDALARHLAVLERRPEIGFTYSGCFRCHDGLDGALVIDGAYPVRPFDDDEYFLELLLSCYTAGPAVLVRTAIQRAAGLYRRDLLRSEDLEMAIRWSLLAPASRLDEARPTYYRRTHAGPRGAAHERFAAVEIDTRARDYERRIVRELGQRLSLAHYLPWSLWQAPMTGELHTRALLRRWTVYMQKGLWPEALTDLSALTSVALHTPDILADVLAIGPRALADHRTREELAQQPAIMKALFHGLRSSALQPLRWCLLRQLYHCTRSHFTARDWRAIIADSRMASRLFGWTWPQRPVSA